MYIASRALRKRASKAPRKGERFVMNALPSGGGGSLVGRPSKDGIRRFSTPRGVSRPSRRLFLGNSSLDSLPSSPPSSFVLSSFRMIHRRAAALRFWMCTPSRRRRLNPNASFLSHARPPAAPAGGETKSPSRCCAAAMAGVAGGAYPAAAAAASAAAVAAVAAAAVAASRFDAGPTAAPSAPPASSSPPLGASRPPLRRPPAPPSPPARRWRRRRWATRRPRHPRHPRR